jgi:competence protein ComEA
MDRVAGIGPGLLKTIGPHVVFSGASALTGGQTGGTPAPLNVNTASLAELDALPGIGPAKARAILRYREEHGAFAEVEALAGVPGLSGAALARLKERVVAR